MRSPWSQHGAGTCHLGPYHFLCTMNMQLILSSAGPREMSHPFKLAGWVFEEEDRGQASAWTSFLPPCLSGETTGADDFLALSRSEV